AEGFDRHLRMAPVGRGNHDCVHVPRGDHLPVVRELLPRQIIDLVEGPVAKGRKLQSVDGRYRVGVLAAHGPNTNDADPHILQPQSPFTSFDGTSPRHCLERRWRSAPHVARLPSWPGSLPRLRIHTAVLRWRAK